MVALLYIDEDQDQRNKVERGAILSGEFTRDQVLAIHPENALEDMIEKVLEHRPRVLITDFRLSDLAPEIEYSGIDLVKEFRQRFSEFPCFVTTSFAGEAAEQEFDTNLVYPKGDFLDRPANEKSGLPFFKRVRSKISEYERTLVRAEEQLNSLLRKQQLDGLTSVEVEQLIELDSFIEASFANDQKIPRHLKEAALEPFSSVTARLEEIVSGLEAKLADEGDSNDE